jgi:hypothetical protein
MALTSLLGIAFPAVTLLGVILWISIFSTTYKNSEDLGERYRKLTGIFNATLISLIIIDVVYLTMILVLRNL